MSCKEAMAAVLDVVQTGGVIPEEQREHLKSCARCRELLDSANQFDAAIHDEHVSEPAIDDKRINTEVRELRFRDLGRRAALAAVIMATLAALLVLTVNRFDRIAFVDMLPFIGIAALISVLPVIFFYVLIAALRDRNGNRICKRLKPGRALSGVCLGLSEATGVPVNVYRLGFIVLTFIKGAGLLLYIVLDLAMPVHPDDRQYLLRFKLRRAFQRRFAHADNDAR